MQTITAQDAGSSFVSNSILAIWGLASTRIQTTVVWLPYRGDFGCMGERQLQVAGLLKRSPFF